MSPRADEVAAAAHLVGLDEARPLTAAERRLLEALIEPLDLAELSEQIARAVVVAQCSCGCPSVGLRTDGPVLPAELVARLSDTGSDDSLGVSAWGPNGEGRDVQVTLHVVRGRLDELEVWPGWDGGEVRTALPSGESLRRE